MTIDPQVAVMTILAAIVGTIIATVIGHRLLDHFRHRDSMGTLQGRNSSLERDMTTCQSRVLELEEQNAELIRQQHHGVDQQKHQQQVEILRMLRTYDGKSLKQIIAHVGISEELAIKHIVDLCRDNCVRSFHYMLDSDSWSLPPDMTVWYIQQAGRDYLANNPT